MSRHLHPGAAAVFAATIFLLGSALAQAPAGWGRVLYAARDLDGGATWRLDEPQSTTWGSNLWVRDLASGVSTPLILPAMLPAGVTLAEIDVQSPKLSYDASKVIFSARFGPAAGWDLYEIDLLASTLRQVTGGGLHDDELHPAYLPDGDIVFVSNRHRQYDEYDGLFTLYGWVRHNTCTVLYRCRPDGTGMVRLSRNQSHELFPSILRNGRILHSFWLKETDGKREFRFPAWRTDPDGGSSFPLFGDHGWFKGVTDLAELPDGRIAGVNVFFQGGFSSGPVVLMRPHDDDFENDYSVITPGVPYLFDSPAGRYRTPRPTPDGRLIVSWSPTGTWSAAPDFGVYVMNLDGSGRTLLFNDPAVDELDPIPVVPYAAVFGQAAPAVRPGPANPQDLVTAVVQSKDARFGDIPARGIRKKASSFSPAEIVALRVLAGVPNRTRQYLGEVEPEIILGEVPLEADGSVRIEVPANTPFHFQGLNADGVAVVHEAVWQFQPPGKTFTCGGCHAHQSGPSPNPAPIAFTQPAVPVGPGLPGYREIEFARDIQPLLLARCTPCHHAPGASGPPAGGLDLETDAFGALLADMAGTTLGDQTFTWVDEGPRARRYVTQSSANESLLVWKLFGQRLDGRTNQERQDDVDYQGQPMPPPGSGYALTAAERKLLVQWIDSGARRALGTLALASIPDSDGDGIKDFFVVDEPYAWTAPLDAAPQSQDGDGDGIPDGAEDRNRDGVVDSGETDPAAADTDADGIEDGVERQLGSDPVDKGSLPAQVDARRGGVNAAAGPVVPVLKVNGSAGDAWGRVLLGLGQPLVATLDDAPAGPAVSPASVWLYAGEPGPAEVVTLPLNLGLMAFSPFDAANPVFGTVAGGLVAALPAGFSAPVTVTAQGYVFDLASQSPAGISVTNAVVLLVN